MNKFSMLLLSATICASSSAFAMFPGGMDEQSFRALPQHMRDMILEEQGYATAAAKMAAVPQAQNAPVQDSSELPSEYISHLKAQTIPAKEDSLPPIPLEFFPGLKVPSTFEDSLPSEYFPGLKKQEEPKVQLPAEYFSTKKTETPVALLPADPRDVEVGFESVFNKQHNIKDTDTDANDKIPTLNMFTANMLMIEKDIGIIKALGGKPFNILGMGQVVATSNEAELDALLTYLNSPIFPSAPHMNKQYMQVNSISLHDDILYRFHGHDIEVPNHGVDSDEKTIEHSFEEQYVKLKKVNPVAAPAVETKVASTPIDQYNGGS